MQVREAKNIDGLAAARKLVLDQRRSDTECEQQVDVLLRQQNLERDGTELLDQADDRLVNFIDAVGPDVFSAMLKRIEGYGLYSCIGMPTREELESLFHLHSLSELLDQLALANAAEAAQLERAKKPTLAVRDRRAHADAALIAHLQTAQYDVVVNALRVVERRVLHYREVDNTDEVMAELLLYREFMDRLEHLGRMDGEHGHKRRHSPHRHPVTTVGDN